MQPPGFRPALGNASCSPLIVLRSAFWLVATGCAFLLPLLLLLLLLLHFVFVLHHSCHLEASALKEAA